MGRLEVLSRAVQEGLGRRRAVIAAAVVTAIALVSFSAPAGAQTTHDVYALDNFWEPDEVQANAGDTIRWRWDNPALFGVHDLWLGTPANPREQLSDQKTLGGAPVERPFPTEGEFAFFCSLHPAQMTGTIVVGPPPTGDTDPPVTTATLDPASPGPGGTYSGPVTVTLTADDGGGSGVDTIEYAIDGGASQTYSAPFVVSASGSHTVSYHATDNEGNSEQDKQLAFSIAGSGGGGGGGGGGTPPPALPSAPDQPQTPFVDLDDLPKRLPAADLLHGLRVGAACQGVDGGTVRITVRGRNARKLGLGKKKAVALAEGSANCDQGRLEAMLKPKRKAKKALKRLRGSAKATLELQMTGSNGRAAESETLVLEGKKKG